MRLIILLASLLVIGVVVTSPILAQSEDQQQMCEVSANYQEAMEENNHLMLRVLSMANVSPSPLEDPDRAGLFYTALISIRHYYEDKQSELPACAQALNQVSIATVTASQDVIGLMLTRQADPTNKRYETHIENAVDHLNAVWQDLIRVSQETSLTSVDE